LAVIAAFAIGAGFFGSRLPSSFLPEEDQGYLFVNMQLRMRLHWSERQRRRGRLRRSSQLRRRPYTTSVAGFSLLSFVRTSYNAFYFVTLKPWSDRTTSAEQFQEIKAHLNKELSRLSAGNRLQFLAARNPWGRHFRRIYVRA